MARVSLVRVDSSVSPVCASTGFGGLVNVDAGDNEVLGFKLIGHSVGLSIL